MASYREHLMFSSVLGSAYASLGVWYFNLDWGTAFLGAGLTALGGLLPDLDSDSGVPVRELFNLAAAVLPLMMLETFQQRFSSIQDLEKPLVLAAGIYLFVRYGVSKFFKRVTVHRGMFHSIPAIVIAGLLVFMLYSTPFLWRRIFVSFGMMLGFLSHLVLDEIYSVDFMGGKLRLNKFAGSALKFWSKSRPATISTYVILSILVWATWLQVSPETLPPFLNPFLSIE